MVLEASLGELEAVQQRLVDQEKEMKVQIEELTEELKANQDPIRMQLIQEMISVRFLVTLPIQTTRTMWSLRRNCWVKCLAYRRRHPSLRQSSKTSQRIFKYWIWQRKTLC